MDLLKIDENLIKFCSDEIIEDEIGQSTNSKVYFVKRDNKKYVVKLFYNKHNYQNELKRYYILDNKINLAKILYSNYTNRYGIIVMEHICGIASFDLKKESDFQLMFEQISNLHNIKIKNRQLNNGKYKITRMKSKIEKYYQNRLISIDIYQYFIRNNPQNDNKLVHGDLTLANIIKSKNNFYFIDLAEVMYGDIYVDILLMLESLFYNTLEKYIEMFLLSTAIKIDINKLNWIRNYFLYIEQRCILSNEQFLIVKNVINKMY